MSRRQTDTIAQLDWPGATDPEDFRYVPPELRDLVANIPADVEQKLRKQLYSQGGELLVSIGQGRGSRSRTLSPATDDADFEVALVTLKNTWARNKLDVDRSMADRNARDVALYTCGCCTRVVVPSGIQTGLHTQRRVLADNTTITVCGSCFAVAQHDAVERLAAERIGGKTRRERARNLVNGATP